MFKKKKFSFFFGKGGKGSSIPDCLGFRESTYAFSIQLSLVIGFFLIFNKSSRLRAPSPELSTERKKKKQKKNRITP